MSRVLHVAFDPESARWEIGLAAWTGRGELRDLEDGLQAGFDALGNIVELIVDVDADTSAPIAPSARARVGEVFGEEAAALLDGGAALDPVDRTITVASLSPAHVGNRLLEGEPGIPTRQSGGLFVVPAPTGELELRVSGDELDITVTKLAEDGLWVRVADSETGILLALGRVRTARDGSGRALITFGLDREVEDLHIGVTSTPLSGAPNRTERRAEWADELLAEAERLRRRRPGAARRLAARAAGVAEAIGDTDRAQRAAAIERSARRWRFLPFAGGTVAVAIAVGVPLGLSGNRGSDQAAPVTTTIPVETSMSTSTTAASTTVPAPSTTEPSTAAPTGPSVWPGPSTYVFAEDGTSLIVAAGDGFVTAGSRVDLDVKGSVLFPNSVYSGATKELALDNCVKSAEFERARLERNMPERGIPQGDWFFEVTPLFSGPYPRRLVPEESVNLSPDSVIVADAASCTADKVTFDAKGKQWVITVPDYVWRVGTIAAQVPGDLPSGLWEMRVYKTGVDQEVQQATASRPIVLWVKE